MLETPILRPVRIVVANDDPTYLEMLKDVLSDYDYDVHTCLTVDEAYQRIIALRPDLVIVDLLFPGTKQGIDLITMLRLNTTTDRIPVIVCSAATRALREMEDYLRSNNMTPLYKPFNLDDLLSVVEQAQGSLGDRSSPSVP